MILVPVSAYVQEADQKIREAEVWAARLSSYEVSESPEAIQGAWRLASEPDASRFGTYLYITLSHDVHLPYDNLYPPFGWLLPSEYGNRLRFNTLSDREWNFLETGWMADWREGRMKLLDDVTLEIRSWRSDRYGGSVRQETVETYKRVLPRPGPSARDFSVGWPLPPEALLGKWEAVESNGTGQTMEVVEQSAKPTNQTLIRFKPPQPLGDASEMTDTTWTGGRFVPWGSRRWWFRTAFGPKQQDALFELGLDGTLRVTQKPEAESSPSRKPPTPPRNYRRVE